MKLEQFVEHLGDNLLKSSVNRQNEVFGVTCDSRRVKKGDIFVAIKGDAFNGEEFIEEALEKGAALIVSESPNSSGLQVSNAYRAYSCLAELFAGMPAKNLSLIGITGTNGKSSTAFILESILCDAGISTGVIGTIHNRFGNKVETSTLTTPDALVLQSLFSRMKKASVKTVVFEVSSHALSQYRLGSVSVNTAIFTNLTHDHLDYHGDMEAYYLAKKKLFVEFLNEDGTAIINVNDEYGQRLVKDIDCRKVVTVGNNGDFQLLNVECGRLNSSFRLKSEKYELAVKVPLQGQFNVMNAALAIVAALQNDVSPDTIVESLKTFPGVPGRLEMFVGEHGQRVFVDYAHTPDALEKALETLKPLADKVICIFGCGGDRDKSKREAMASVAETFADFVIVTDDNPRTENPKGIIDDILLGFKEKSGFMVEGDRYKAIEIGIGRIGESDVLLVAGKGHEDYQIYGTEKQKFCDRSVVKEILGRISA